MKGIPILMPLQMILPDKRGVINENKDYRRILAKEISNGDLL